MDRNQAVKATRNGAIAACVSAAVTIIFILVAIKTDAEGKLALWNDPFNFIDVALVIACAYGIYRKSRVASVLLFVYFVAVKIIIAIETQSYSGFGVALIFLYFYARAIQGSFVYHRLEKQLNPDYKPPSALTYIIAIPSVILVAALVGFSLMSVAGIVPSTRVLSANEIIDSDMDILRANDIVSAEDNIEFFYSQGLSSILESGNVMTQDRVILYFTDENGDLQVYEIYLNEITEVVLESQGNAIDDSVYRVNTRNPDLWLKLYLSSEQKGDQKFVNALRNRISR